MPFAASRAAMSRRQSSRPRPGRFLRNSTMWPDTTRLPQARTSALGLLFSTLPLDLAQLEALDLAGLGARQGRDELDRPGIFIRGDLGLGEILNILDQRLARHAAGAEHDECFYDLAAAGVGGAHNGAFQHLGVIEQRGFHLGTRDVVAGADDHVVGARVVPVVALGVLAIGIARQVPTVPHVFLLLLEVVEIAATRGAADSKAS